MKVDPKRQANSLRFPDEYTPTGISVRAELEGVGVIPTRAKTIRGLARAVLDDPSLLQPPSQRVSSPHGPDP